MRNLLDELVEPTRGRGGGESGVGRAFRFGVQALDEGAADDGDLGSFQHGAHLLRAAQTEADGDRQLAARAAHAREQVVRVVAELGRAAGDAGAQDRVEETAAARGGLRDARVAGGRRGEEDRPQSVL
jgi:hypothetical protein